MSGATLDLRGTFLAVVDALAEADVPHAFIGALPVLAWGRVRATTDIDLVVAVAGAWDRLRAAFSARGIELAKTIGPAESADVLPDIAVFQSAGDTSVRVDVFIAKTDFERTVVTTARTSAVFDAEVRLARPEASIIYKLLARRPRDLDDVESIFEGRHAAGDDLDWGFLDEWASDWGITQHLAPYRARFGPRR